MQFKIEQLALRVNPTRHTAAIDLLIDCGMLNWVRDTVTAKGLVRDCESINTANLSFNYDAIDGKELELLEYIEGNNWLQPFGDTPMVSHIGMHCTEDELEGWYALMERHKCPVVQDVRTLRHTNPIIKDTRRYHYVIFGTRWLIGVDMKFIVRIEV